MSDTQTSFVLKIQANVSTIFRNRPDEVGVSKSGRPTRYFREPQDPFPCRLLETEILFGITGVVISQNRQRCLHEKLPASGHEIIWKTSICTFKIDTYVCVIGHLDCTPTRIAKSVSPELYAKLKQDIMLEIAKFKLK